MPKERVSRLAIVGSTLLKGREDVAVFIGELLDWIQPTLVISGGAEGVDKMAALAAQGRGISTREHVPQVTRWVDKSGKNLIGFRERNKQIVRDCDALVRIAKLGSKTYGSGWTRDYAIAQGKPTAEQVFE